MSSIEITDEEILQRAEEIKLKRQQEINSDKNAKFNGIIKREFIDVLETSIDIQEQKLLKAEKEIKRLEQLKIKMGENIHMLQKTIENINDISVFSTDLNCLHDYCLRYDPLDGYYNCGPRYGLRCKLCNHITNKYNKTYYGKLNNVINNDDIMRFSGFIDSIDVNANIKTSSEEQEKEQEQELIA